MKKDNVINAFKEFVAIESVSADPNRHDQMTKASDMLIHKLSSMGFEIHTFVEGKNPPLIVAVKSVKSVRSVKSADSTSSTDSTDSTKTIGIYGHYDVQPEDPIDEWKTPPFGLTVKDGKIWGRGTADNKGHVVQNIVAIEELIANNKLTNNIVFVLEGEEEKGSVYLEQYLKQAASHLSKVDVFYVTDVGMHEKNMPQIFYALRGLIYFEITVSVGIRDMHSGLYGNRVYNLINVLTDLIASMKDIRTGKVLIPGFYDSVREVPKEELELLEKVFRSDEDEAKEAGTYTVTPVSAKIHPSFDAHGIVGGYTAPGAKTVIPKEASAKFSFRLVEDQDPQKIEALVTEFVKKHLPEGVRYTLTTVSKDGPFYTDINNEYVKKTRTILTKVFGHETVVNRSGGSIPAAEMFQRLFKKPIILTGFTLPDENLHAPNENFDEEMFWKGIDALQEIYSTI